MKDCIIIGSGPAGVSAALTLKALNVDFMLLGKKALSGKIRAAEHIRNYPGFFDIGGKELAAAFSNQLSQAGIEICEERVTGIYPTGTHYTVLSTSNQYECKSVILATGVENVKPIDGEERLLGRGVSYCATCDGMLYKNKTIAVVCTSKEHEREIDFLSSLAHTVYVFPVYKNPALKGDNLIVQKGMPQAIFGEQRVEGITVGDTALKVDGVFVLKDAYPAQVLLNGLKTTAGHIEVTRNAQTNLKGVFAAGDCTGRPYQYVKAAGEGNVAAHAVFDYLSAQRNAP